MLWLRVENIAGRADVMLDQSVTADVDKRFPMTKVENKALIGGNEEDSRIDEKPWC